MKPAPITHTAIVVACFEPPCTRYLKRHRDGRFTSTTTLEEATRAADEEAARDMLNAYFARLPSGVFWGTGSVWQVCRVTTKTTVEVVKAETRTQKAPDAVERRGP